MGRLVLRSLMFTGGTVLAFLNLFPLPWSLRLSWAKFLYWLTVKGTFLLPSIFAFVETQNLAYGMGKQRNQSLSSILELEKVVTHLESGRVSLDEIAQMLGSAEARGISAEELPRFLAQRAFGIDEGTKVLRMTAQDRQTW